MEVSAKELRGKPGRIIEEAARGTEIIITFRGKRKARLIPYQSGDEKKTASREEDLIFGMWADKDDLKSVDEQVRTLRKGRIF